MELPRNSVLFTRGAIRGLEAGGRPGWPPLVCQLVTDVKVLPSESRARYVRIYDGTKDLTLDVYLASQLHRAIDAGFFVKGTVVRLESYAVTTGSLGERLVLITEMKQIIPI